MKSKTIISFVSIIMPVYNGNKFVSAAINSILKQTYTSFEFIIIDDGSTDETAKTVQTFMDNRILFIQNKVNKGLVFSLNKAIELAKGKYIARMDADDVALLTRIEKQVNFLEKNPKVALVGTNIQFLINNKLANKMRLPSTNKAAHCRLLFNTTFVHPSVMLRSEILKVYQYDAQAFPAEDYDLWVRIAQNHQIANLNQTLLHCRLHNDNIHLNTRETVLDSVSNIYKYVFKHSFSYAMTPEDIKTHQTLCLYRKDFSLELNKKIELWIIKIQQLNKQIGVFPDEVFNKQLAEIWIYYAYNYIRFGKRNMNIFKSKLIFNAPFLMIIKIIIFTISNTLKIKK
jgi:glycosyltransferase involved in cell wall biosynthesis